MLNINQNALKWEKRNFMLEICLLNRELKLINKQFLDYYIYAERLSDLMLKVM